MNDRHQYILPTTDLIHELRRLLSQMTYADYRLEDLIAASIACLEYRVSTRIPEYAEQLMDRHALYGGTADGSRISKAWFWFTTAMYDLYDILGLWNTTGRCDYYFKRMLGDDIVIERYDMDYTPLIVPSFYQQWLTTQRSRLQQLEDQTHGHRGRV